jgi:hypothetical protein
MKQVSVLAPSLLVFIGVVGIDVACTPAQRQNARTALEVNQCVTAISLRHIDAGDDLKDPLVLARIAAEMTDECGPLLGH